MSIFNGRKSDDEIREEQRRNQQHQTNLSAAHANGDGMSEQYIDKMTSHSLAAGTVERLSNLLDEDFMLGNLQEAEVHEYRWLARVAVKEVEGYHPREGSIWQGAVRAAAKDDVNEARQPLSAADRAEVEQFVMGAIARATRGREGWQQEMFNKTITASETREIDSDDDGGFI
jgi:hypothetical protein